MTRVDFRPMGGRSGYSWLIGTAVLVLGMSAYGFVTDPPNRPYTLFGPLLVAFFVFVISRNKQWLEVTSDDVTLVQQRAFKTVRVQLAGAKRIFLRGNHGGCAQIVAVGSGGTAFAGLLNATMYAQGYQGVDVLAALLTGVRRNRGVKSGAIETAELLQRQLVHAQAAGPVATAPLMAYASDVTAAIAATGAAGAAGKLSDLP